MAQTSTDGSIPHSHSYTIDDSGNGSTAGTNAGPAHSHKIRNFEVAPADADRHTHSLAANPFQPDSEPEPPEAA